MRGSAVSLLAGMMLLASCGQSAPEGEAATNPGRASGGASGSKSGGSGGSKNPGSGGAPASGSGGSASGGSSAGAAGSGGSSSNTGGAAGGAGGGSASDAAGTSADAGEPADVSAPGGDAAPAGEGFMGLPPPPPGMTKIFNGVDLEGWECLPAAFGVKDGSIWAHYSGEDLCRTKADYSNFRVVFNENGGGSANHMGFGFWGDHGGRYGNALVVIPPSGAIWDYVRPEAMLTGGVGSANNPIKHQWHQVEIIANRMTGRIMTAVNGKLVSDYTDKRLNVRKHGPIGFQDHGGASNHFYRDVYIENEPKEFKLLTLKP